MGDAVEILRTAAEDKLAVVGMGVDFPFFQTLNGFLDEIYRGKPVSVAKHFWQADGALSRAALNAIQDCAWEGAQYQVIGSLVIGSSFEVNRFSTLSGITGPVVDFAGYSEPLPAMLIQAHEWLMEHEVEAIILAGSFESELVHPQTYLFGFDQSVHVSLAGSGAAAVVVMRKSDAQRLGLKIYAFLESMAYISQPTRTNIQNSIASCAQSALQAAGLRPVEIGCLDALACGDDAVDVREITGLCAAYHGEPNRTVIGSSQSLTGFTDGINGLVGLVWAGLCLVNRLRPGVNGWTGPKYPELWSGSNFYIPTESLTWFQNESIGSRKAAINLIGKDESCAHLILSGAIIPVQVEPFMRMSDAVLIPVGSRTPDDWIGAVQGVQKGLQQGSSLPEVAMQAYRRIRDGSHSTIAVFLAHNSEEALREIEFGLRGIPSAIQKGSEWQTPTGSYFTPNPLGPDSRVAFVYPGAFNSYVGVGKDLFYLFPTVYDHFQEIAEDVGAVLCDEQIYPRSLSALNKSQVDQAEADLLDDANAMMVSGSALSVNLTGIFKEIFQIEPYSAFGYSLGENSMMFSMGVWGDGLYASQRLFASPLFRTRLAGPQNAVRASWGLPSLAEDAHPEEPLWENFLLMAPVERVKDALRAESKVYLTHINTPRQVVIGGDPAACRRVINLLKCSSLKAPFDYVLHCKVMESEYEALYEIHSLPVSGQRDVKLYSAAEDRPFVLTQSDIARAVARDLCSMLDFPRLVETAYADGARVFIELGAGSNCAKWIEDVLRGKPFLSVSANRKGVDDATSILRVLARLASHQIKVNLEPLYRDQVFHG
jgi:PfaB family protein